MFEWPQYHCIYWDTRAAEWALGQAFAYFYMTRDKNCIADNMDRWVLELQTIITFWDG